jgi:hypothetical protein
MPPFPKRRPVMFTMAHYRTLAGMIRTIEDPGVRQAIADHLATEFNKRSPAFDPVQWGKDTGGKPAPNSARMSGGPRE